MIAKYGSQASPLFSANHVRRTWLPLNTDLKWARGGASASSLMDGFSLSCFYCIMHLFVLVAQVYMIILPQNTTSSSLCYDTAISHPANTGVSSPSGKGKHISAGGAAEWITVCSVLFYLGFSHSPFSPALLPPSAGFFFFHSVVFPQLFRSLHCYLGIVYRENNATSCFGCTMADVLLVWRNFSFVFAEKNEKQSPVAGQIHKKIQPLHYTPSVFINAPEVFGSPIVFNL